MRALVVDDEGPARRRLARMLDAVGVQVVAQLEDATALSDALAALTVDVVFLDVRMPGVDGMSFAQSRAEAHAEARADATASSPARPPSLPPIVFVTAHDEYAARAFGVDAVDYLLKPVRPERLMAAVERVRKRAASAATGAGASLASAAPVAAPTASAPSALSQAPRIVVTSRQLIQLFDARSITRFWSSDKYTLFRAGSAEHMTEEPLAALAERLLAFGFLRVHRAELVRSDAVSALRLVDGRYELCLSDGQQARVSRRALPAIKLALGLG